MSEQKSRLTAGNLQESLHNAHSFLYMPVSWDTERSHFPEMLQWWGLRRTALFKSDFKQ